MNVRNYEIGDTVIKMSDDGKWFYYGVVGGFFMKNGEEYLYFINHFNERSEEEPTKSWRLLEESDLRNCIPNTFYILPLFMDKEPLTRRYYDYEIDQEVEKFMRMVRENKRRVLEERMA